jgi:secretion/DNA translocation related CpaE-like protein
MADSLLRDEVERVAAAVGVGVIQLAPTATVGRRAWSAAVAVILDEAAAQRCAMAGLPRRGSVFVLVTDAPNPTTFQAAISVGAQRVLTLPVDAGELVAELSSAGDNARADTRRGEVIAVIGGRGGAGASLFATALAQSATEALLVDLDPWSGGIDLLLGTEMTTGLRWPDLAVKSGRLSWTALRDALPRQRDIRVLSATRRDCELSGGAVDAVIDAGRRGGATVVCDLPRRLTEAAEAALDAADLVVVVSQCDVHSCASTAAMAPALTARNPNVGVVVRGPSPGGLRAVDIAEIATLPLLAAMRPEPLLAEKLERGGLQLGPRSPLATAAGRVLTVLGHRPVNGRGRGSGLAA